MAAIADIRSRYLKVSMRISGDGRRRETVLWAPGGFSDGL